METVIKKWGNSLGIRIPANLLKEYDMSDGTTIEFIPKKEGIVLVPRNKEERLDQMLAKIDDSNLHRDDAFEEREGNEIW